jgi:hypothetical protein
MNSVELEKIDSDLFVRQAIDPGQRFLATDPSGLQMGYHIRPFEKSPYPRPVGKPFIYLMDDVFRGYHPGTHRGR